MKFIFSIIIVGSIFNFTQPEFNWFKPLYEESNFFNPLHSISPVIYNELIISPGKNLLTGMNLSNGRKIWTKEFPDEILSTPLLYDEKVFLSTLGGKIYIINPKNGDIIRMVTIINSSIISDFAFSNGKLIFKTNHDELIALDINSSEILWSYKRKNVSDWTINLFPSPVIHNNIAYAGFSDGVVAGIDIITGKEQWSLKLPAAKKFEGIYASPVILKDRLIVPKYDSGLYSISIEDKKIIWAKEDEGYLWCAITGRSEDDSLYCASISGKLLKINPYSGNSHWMLDFYSNKKSLFKRKLLSLSKPSINNNTMFLCAINGLYAIDLSDGRILWRFNTPGVLFPPGVSSTPIINDDSLIFVSNSGLLYNFQLIK